MKVRRGIYNEILQSSLNDATKKQVLNLVYGAANAEKIDEHGSWDFGAEFDGTGRGASLNWDLYGIGRDYFTKRTLIVIQVRQWSKTRRRQQWARIRKSYFLIGRNEDDTIFAHSVEARVVQAAAKAGKDVVRACQNWIFEQDYTRIIRQGDIGLLPLKTKSVLANAEICTNQFVLQDSHLVKAEEARVNGNLYVKNPSLYHLPKTHPDFENLQGWFKVIEGRRSNFYDFAAPTID